MATKWPDNDQKTAERNNFREFPSVTWQSVPPRYAPTQQKSKAAWSRQTPGKNSA